MQKLIQQYYELYKVAARKMYKSLHIYMDCTYTL